MYLRNKMMEPFETKLIGSTGKRKPHTHQKNIYTPKTRATYKLESICCKKKNPTEKMG